MKRTCIVLSLFLIAAQAETANLVYEGPSRIRVFSSMKDQEGWEAVPRGTIISFSSRDELSGKDFFDTARDKNKATVRLFDVGEIAEGDTLFVINDKNLIVGKMTVRTVFSSVSFGPMLVGYGNLRLCALGERVVAKADHEQAKYAYIYKARGDFYDSTGKQGEAIREYKKALELDPENPSAHLALGLIYKQEGNAPFAIREFKEAEKKINRLYDNEDKFLLFSGIAEIRFNEVYASSLPARMKDLYREEGIRACRRALELHPQSETNLYRLGIFLYQSPEPDDRSARDVFLKLTEINPDHVGANLALSHLYHKHNNPAKARLYAEKAAKSDPNNKRVRAWLKYLDSKEEVRRARAD